MTFKSITRRQTKSGRSAHCAILKLARHDFFQNRISKWASPSLSEGMGESFGVTTM